MDSSISKSTLLNSFFRDLLLNLFICSRLVTIITILLKNWSVNLPLFLKKKGTTLKSYKSTKVSLFDSVLGMAHQHEFHLPIWYIFIIWLFGLVLDNLINLDLHSFTCLFLKDVFQWSRIYSCIKANNNCMLGHSKISIINHGSNGPCRMR